MRIFRIFLAVLVEILPKFSDFVNSNDFIIKKTHQNLWDYNQFLVKIWFEVKNIENSFSLKNIGQIFSSEKLRNSGDCINNYA